MEYAGKCANAEWGIIKQMEKMESSRMLCNQDVSRHMDSFLAPYEILHPTLRSIHYLWHE